MIENLSITAKHGKTFTIVAICMLFMVFGLNAHADDIPPLFDLPDSVTYNEVATPDLFTGGLNYKVPIKVPQGRKGVQPKIALALPCHTNAKGWIGGGWELELGSIERSTNPNVNYTADNYLFHKSDGKFSLVNIGGEYRFRVESNFYRIKKLNAANGRPYWEVTDKSGNRYLFGQSEASRQDDPSNADHVFKWCLDRVEDTNGNYMTLSYTKDRGQIYLDRIDYTGNGALAPNNNVKFYLEDRSDVSVTSTINFNVTTAYRLKSIGVFANYGQIKVYNLSYLIGASSGQSLLTSIKESDRDSLSSLPPITFEWQQNPELLSKITNSLGGKTTIGYTPSTSYNNTNLPITVQTVSSITTDDGNGNVSATRYTYSGGYLHASESDFRGFNYSKVTGPSGSNGVQKITETWFHQGNDTSIDVNSPNVSNGYMKGKPYRTRVTDGNGNKFSEVTTSYAQDADNAAPYFTPPLQVDSYVYDADSSYKQSRTIYISDSYGNITREDQYGDLNDSSDDRTIVRSYYPNTASWIVGLPASETTYQGIGTTNQVASKSYYYDGTVDCTTASTNLTPVKGNLTRVVNWLSGGLNPENWIAYDAYGNTVCSRDANGNITTISYDSSFTFPTTVTNPLGQLTSYQYYGQDNVPSTYAATPTYTCPSGGALQGTSCATTSTHAAAVSYSCSAGEGVLSGTICVNSFCFTTINGTFCQTTTYAATASYSCNAGETLSGTTCTYPTSYAATETYTCNADDTLSGTTCIHTNPDGKGLYGQLKNTTDPNGAVTTVEYDTFGRKTKETRADNSWTTWAYNNFGNVGSQNVHISSSEGSWSETYFDGFGRITQKKASGPDAKTIASDTQYDVTGTINKTSLPYFEGLETPRYKTFTYDPLGRLLQSTNPDSTSKLVCYNDRVKVTIDANNHRKRETFDQFGRLVKVEEYTGTFNTCDTDLGTPYATTTYRYDALGNLRFVTDGKGNQTEIRYDTLGRKTFIHDPDMGEWAYGYDGNGNLVSQTDAKGQLIQFSYDALNRPVSKAYPSGVGVAYAYDGPASTYGKGRLTSIIDGSGATQYSYDSLGRTVRTVRTIDGTSYPIQSSYDGLGRVKSITYPDNETVNYSYDAGGNIWSVGSYATFTDYNALGQPGNLTFGDSVNTTYQYYASNNRLNSITTTSPTQGSVLNLGYKYDNKGNISTINDYVNNARTQNFVYDELDRLSQAQSSYGLLTYSYDQIGNILSKEGTNFNYGTKPHAVTTAYSCPSGTTPSADGTACLSTSFYAAPATYSCSSGGTLQGASCATTSTYAAAATYTCPSGGTLQGTTCVTTSTYATAVTYTCPSGGSLSGTTCNKQTCFTAFYRTFCPTTTYAATANYFCNAGDTRTGTTCTHSISYNATVAYSCNAGDTLSGSICIHPNSYTASLSYSCNTGDVLNGTTCAHTISSSPSLVTYTYDANGNMTTDNQRSISYDYDDMPKTINGSISFIYDGFGRRVKKITPAITRVYIDKLYECNNGNCSKYIFAGNTRIALKAPTQTLYYHPDQLGSTRVVIDVAGSMAEETTYYPFGKTSSDSGPVRVSHQYTSQELDGETGLYNYISRLYAPELGRFIKPDTIVPDYSNPQSLNRYAYVLNNPLKLIDPTGNCAINDLFTMPQGGSDGDSFFESIIDGVSGLISGISSLFTGSSSVGAISGGINGTSGSNIYSSLTDYVLFGPSDTSISYGPYSSSGVDPSGWTVSVGVYGNAALGLGGGGGMAVNVGNSDANGLTWSVTGTAQGGAVAGGGTFIGGGFAYTNADSINQLNGTSYQLGRAGLNAGPFTFAGEGIIGSGYRGGAVYGGVGQFYTANSATASTTSAIIQYNNGILSFGNTGTSAIWSLRIR